MEMGIRAAMIVVDRGEACWECTNRRQGRLDSCELLTERSVLGRELGVLRVGGARLAGLLLAYLHQFCREALHLLSRAPGLSEGTVSGERARVGAGDKPARAAHTPQRTRAQVGCGPAAAAAHGPGEGGDGDGQRLVYG